MASLPNSLATAQQITQQVGAMIPLGQISSVVQTLQNIQGFNAGAFSQLTGTIQSALQGFDQASSIIQNFSSNSPVQAFTDALNATGLAGSSIGQIAGTAATVYRQADSFLNGVSSVQSWQRLNSQRPSVEESRETNRVNDGLQFPKDIGKYWIYLGFERATFSSIKASGSPVNVKRENMGAVTLPPPMNLVDTNQLEYQSLSLTQAALNMGSGAAAIAGAISGGTPGAGGLSRLSGYASMNLTNALSQTTRATLEAAGALTGEALNTHQTLKFVQPTLKTHTFSWKLVPSNEDESKILQAIVNFIKSRIYPSISFGGLGFSYPDLVNVYLYNGDKMYLFKPAYVNGFAVNYTTEGGPSFHKNGYPVAVQIDMTITETAVWKNEDFKSA
jgi:hypothetical protein